MGIRRVIKEAARKFIRLCLFIRLFAAFIRGIRDIEKGYEGRKKITAAWTEQNGRKI